MLAIPKNLPPLLSRLQKPAKEPLYLVGGTLRDIFLNRETIDLDLAYHGPAKIFAAEIARNLGGTLVVLDDVTRVYRIVLRKNSEGKSDSHPITQIDVAQIIGRTIGDDLNRRDFTCNAMALPLTGSPLPLDITTAILDPRKGLADIKNKILRADNPKVFKDDPLRLLRAFRLAAQLEFTIEDRTLKLIQSHRGLVGRPAGERLRQELAVLFSNSDCSRWMRLMDQTGILTGLFKELEASRRCAEVYYGKGGVLKHTLDAVERMDLLLANLDRMLPDLASDIRRHFEDQEGWQRLLRLGILLHDIAKPATAQSIEGRLRFFGHDELGARMASDILRKLRFSRHEIEAISAYILHHLRPGNLAANKIISDKAIFRFFRDLGSHGIGLLLVCWADHASYLTPAKLDEIVKHLCADPHTFPKSKTKDPAVHKTLNHLQVVHFLAQNYFHHRERVLPERMLDGNAVMKALNIPPGPKVGDILARLLEAQAEGKIPNRAAAIAFIKKIKLR